MLMFLPPHSPPLEGCPAGAGWLVPHTKLPCQDHPVRLRLTPLQRRGMGRPPNPPDGGGYERHPLILNPDKRRDGGPLL
jgi:hypothetical protein